jgi:flagellar biosynthesis/type III secretory pathway chaperone
MEMSKTDPIIAALSEQVTCYQRLAKLAEIQHGHVQQGNTESLLKVLQQRQVVLQQLAALEQIIAPVKRQWTVYLDKLDVASRKKAETLLTDSRSLLERITSADRDDVMVLQNQKLNLSRQIGKTTAARQVNRSYAASAYAARPVRMDVKR